jgi:hypothetical protein
LAPLTVSLAVTLSLRPPSALALKATLRRPRDFAVALTLNVCFRLPPASIRPTSLHLPRFGCSRLVAFLQTLTPVAGRVPEFWT